VDAGRNPGTASIPAEMFAPLKFNALLCSCTSFVYELFGILFPFKCNHTAEPALFPYRHFFTDTGGAP
jgi:hypothetical protein